MSIVAARPAMGKSSLGLATADACSKAGAGVHLFSLEDTEQAYADRALSRVSGIEAERMRNADLTNADMPKMGQALRELARRQGWLFDGRSGISAEEIVRSVRRRKKDNKTRVVIVDYVQLVRKPHPRMSTHEALGEIVTTLADAAKHDGMAYVVMSQLNRELEKRDDRRPLLSDLRESGSLEEFEIVAVEETDTPSTIEGIKYVSHPIADRGFPFARNIAIRHASGDILVFLDDDCMIQGDWLTDLLEVFNDPDVVERREA